MAFPQIAGSALSQAGSATPSYSLPAGVAAGDLVFAFIFRDVTANDPTITWPGSWQPLEAYAGTHFAVYIGYLVASGGETTVQPTFPISERGMAIAVRIAAADWHGTTPPEISTVVDGASANPDPGSLAPSWGAEDSLWIVVAGADSFGLVAPTAYPANYNDNQLSQHTQTSSGHGAIATRELNAASEDPGAFTLGISESWGAWTIAVRPVAGGGGVQQDITPDALNEATVYAPSLSVGAVNVTPDLLGVASILAPTVAAGAVTLTPGLLHSSEIYEPALSGVVSVSLDLIQESTIYEPTVVGAQIVAIDIIEESDIYAPSVVADAITVELDLISDSDIYSPSVTATSEVTIGIIEESAVYSPTVAPGSVNVTVDLIGEAVLYGMTFTQGQNVAVDLLGESTIYDLAVVPGAVNVTPGLLGVADIFDPSFTTIEHGLGNVTITRAKLYGTSASHSVLDTSNSIGIMGVVVSHDLTGDSE